MDDERKYRLIAKAMDSIVTLGRTAIYGAVLYSLIVYGHLVGVAFAGKTTEANIVVAVLANLEVDRWFAYLFGIGGIGYGVAQRRLRRRNIRRLTGHTEEMEHKVYPDRTSSGLTPTGRTRAEDR